MNVFERLQSRLSKSATLVPHPAEKITPPVDQSKLQTSNSPTQLTTQQGDYLFHSSLQAPKNYPDPGAQSSGDIYECSEEWSTPPGTTARSSRTETLPVPETGRSSRPVVGDTAYALAKQAQRKTSTQTQSQVHRAKTPLSSFYNVSSDEDDDDDVDGEEFAGDDLKDENGDPTASESAAAFERRSLRIRRSIDKAKAALPADFVDRIGVAPVLTDSVYRDRSVSRPSVPRFGTNELDDPGIQPTPGEFSSSDDEADSSVQPTGMDGDYTNYSRSSPDKCKTNVQSEMYNEADDRLTLTSSGSKCQSAYMSQSGILWYSEQPQPLEEMVPRFRSDSPGLTYLTKAIAQRSGCRCALCGHDSLLLFPVLDASLALASWASWSIASKSHSRSNTGHDRNAIGLTVATVTEVHAQLAVFRQCRGWYEVLNENQQAIPHLTTVEQFRRAKPATFLIRRDLKCLAAPPTLLVPPLNDSRPSNDGPPPVPFPSSVIAIATSPDTLNNSVPETIPAGSLMHFVTYLPHCQLRRGRKIKEMGLILATKRVPGSPIRRSTSSELSNGNHLPSRAYYIGVEDTTPAVFHPRFSISPVAGPENISGVHSMASILRKFRLPLSIRPVYGIEGSGAFQADPTDRLPNGSTGLGRNLTPANTALSSCGLAAVQGLQFTEKHFLRLQSMCRGDILIFAPVASPERLFLITPSMLRDHVFQLGSSSDPAYERLLEGHRMQSINFLASAHSRDSLNYLVRHMRDVTREPRESYTTRKANRHRSDTTRGANPDSGHPELTPEEMYQIYDDLDDIYFFIRHGYYPSKNRVGETPNRTTTESIGANRSTKNSFSSPSPLFSQEQSDVPDPATRKSDAGLTGRPNVPTAEQLLSAALKTPVRNHTFQTKWSNISNNTASTYRVQPKEYGI
ncbi:hypothetical protein FGIG_01680 [Fasciola gigantica]|uniref:CABIT domain-containing protein n=1 Tax=Fasciola gigantica TaxID=46835 RepID=A0A504YCI3_FASGI|nr:hypothetical protein FGIG_01680 [Fasciola gigantica]